jgi:starch phosphorylase
LTAGFAIGSGRVHANQDIQDDRDAKDLTKVLLNEVIPLFYDRDVDELPRQWIARMKRSVSTMGWKFNSDRMVMDYVTTSYLPAAGGLYCDMTRMA